MNGCEKKFNRTNSTLKSRELWLSAEPTRHVSFGFVIGMIRNREMSHGFRRRSRKLAKNRIKITRRGTRGGNGTIGEEAGRAMCFYFQCANLAHSGCPNMDSQWAI